MNTIVTDILEILKKSTGAIEREKNMQEYIHRKMCSIVQEAFERLDDELWQAHKRNGCRSLRRDERSLITSYGTIRLKRRLLKDASGKAFYPVDQEMGFRKYQRISPYFQYNIARIASKTVYRTTAMAVEVLTGTGLSHQQISNILHRVGNTYETWEQVQRNQEIEPTAILHQPETLRIEGDGVEIKGQGMKHLEIHRFQIAEGVKTQGGRRVLTGVHCVASTSHKEAKEQMQAYIESHYDLNRTLVLSNSDGGPGYSKEVFDEILGVTKRHEHFRDPYHVNKKGRDRLSFIPKDLTSKLQRTIWKHDRKGVCTWLDTMDSMAVTEQQREQVKLYRQYLKRHWEYLKPLTMRGVEITDKGLGTCESGHRIYSYRMKKQGRRWGKQGGEAMVKIITGLRNGDLMEALDASDEYFNRKPGKEYKCAMRQIMKKHKMPHLGIQHGRIYHDCAASTAIGHLARIFA